MNPARRSIAVLLLSAGVLAWEVLLIRIFAIQQFHHFASMAIGVAMLGVGTAGTGFALLRATGRVDPARWFVPLSLSAAVAFALVPLGAETMPVDPTVLAWDVRQWFRLAALYLLLALPFFLAALATLAALAGAGDRPGMVYGASLAGSGLGAGLALGVLWVLEPLQATPVPALLSALAAGVAPESGTGRIRGAVLVALLAAGLLILRPPARLHPLPYKSLPQVLGYPDARVVTERGSPAGWVVAVQAQGFRYAPGLSLAYRGSFPRQTAIFSDGDLVGALSSWDSSSVRLLEWQPSALPFVAGGRDRVLIVGGGAHELANAIHHGASRVTVVEPLPQVASLSREGPLPSGINRAVVDWRADHARSVLSQGTEHYDLVLIGPSAGGSPGLSTTTLAEEYDLTVEAYQQYLHALAPDGMLAVTGWSSDPPAENLRIILTAMAALRRQSEAQLAGGVMVVRSWGTATTLVKPAGFTPGEVDRLEQWAASRWFDVDWRPGIETPISQFNLVDRPLLFEAARAATVGADSADQFASGMLFDVRPATDARPYPHHVTGLRALRQFLGRPKGDWLAWVDWGSLALVATLVQGAPLGAIVMGVPLFWRRRRPTERSRVLLAGYFMGIGVGYLAAEIAAMQQLVLLLGHPAYSVTVVLGALLVASGAGALLSDRLRPDAGWKACGVLGLVLIGYALGLLPLIQLTQAPSMAVRGLLAVLLLIPAALLMGSPFSLGLRQFAGADSIGVAWCWAANGLASVITAPLAALIALEAGTPLVFGLAAAGYLVAAVCAARKAREGQTVQEAPACPPEIRH